jgi:hypothetical protein
MFIISFEYTTRYNTKHKSEGNIDDQKKIVYLLNKGCLPIRLANGDGSVVDFVPIGD